MPHETGPRDAMDATLEIIADMMRAAQPGIPRWEAAPAALRRIYVLTERTPEAFGGRDPACALGALLADGAAAPIEDAGLRAPQPA